VKTLEIVFVFVSISLLGISFLLVEASENMLLRYKNFYYIAHYNTTDGITIDSVNVSEPSLGIMFSLKAESNGNMSINFPSSIIQARYKCQPSGLIDFPYVLANRAEVDFTISENSNRQNVLLSIPISKEVTELEIVFSADMGSWAFPTGCPIKLFENAISYSPKKQIENGILPTQVICKENLAKIFKPSSNLPICVKSETKIKLVERDWSSTLEKIQDSK